MADQSDGVEVLDVDTKHARVTAAITLHNGIYDLTGSYKDKNGKWQRQKFGTLVVSPGGTVAYMRDIKIHATKEGGLYPAGALGLTLKQRVQITDQACALGLDPRIVEKSDEHPDAAEQPVLDDDKKPIPF